MASTLLGNIGSGVGARAGAFFGVPFGGRLGRLAGTALSRYIEDASERNETDVSFADLALQHSAYGKTIPVLYGTMRLAGNIIWALPIREVRRTRTTGASKGGGASKSSSGSVERYATLAIALCEGEATRVERVWANDALIDPARLSMRFYTGSETQAPDSAIEADKGVGLAPAYRGLCYVVLEDVPLSDYGNRLPNFTFEVTRVPPRIAEADGAPAPEDAVTCVTIIPGAGEHVYDTNTQYLYSAQTIAGAYLKEGHKTPINHHGYSEKTDAVAAIDRLQETFPHLEWVSVVVSWFGDSLDAGACVFTPGVEFRSSKAITAPDAWSVAGYTRETARLLTQDANDRPVYGGTPSDAGLVRFIDALKSRGLKVMAYPMPFMDVEGKPWRGHITGDAADIPGFFTGTHGYNAFITHYAELLGDKVDAFIVGSELKGLTSVRSGASFPAVDALIDLAQTVKGIVDPSVKVTYAADWSEYHHTDDGYYHLDPLWASPYVDMVGVDAYFPLTNAYEENISYADVLAGWEGGEGYDYYYTDEARTTTAPLSPEYAWKNLAWWHGNVHTNPGGATTAWTPGMKPIWFTEYGFPSVDGATNQPNVFYDPNSSDGGLPRLSRGEPSAGAQRRGIAATEAFWEGSVIVENKFLWTWDARPYPAWPDRSDVWADAYAWRLGHWTQGKLGQTRLCDALADLFRRAGYADGDYDASNVGGTLGGFAIARDMTSTQAIQTLQRAYDIAIREENGVLVASDAALSVAASVETDDLAIIENAPEDDRTRRDAPASLEVSYLDRSRLYETGMRRAFVDHATGEGAAMRFPLAMDGAEAARAAERLLARARANRDVMRVGFTRGDMRLVSGDLVVIDGMRYGVGKCVYSPHGVMTAELSRDDARFSMVAQDGPTGGAFAQTAPTAWGDDATALHILHLPYVPNVTTDERAFYAALSSDRPDWPGGALLISTDGGAQYRALASSAVESMVGYTAQDMAAASPFVSDETGGVEILFSGDALPETVSEREWLAGTNAIYVNGEIILFRHVEPLGASSCRLSGFMRGAFATEASIAAHPAGSAAILIDAALVPVLDAALPPGATCSLKAVTFGASEDDADPVETTALCAAQKPLAPVRFTAKRQDDNALDFRWIRRPRRLPAWIDGADAPLVESSEKYRLRIYDAADALLREEFLTASEFSYAAAMQTSDGLSLGDYGYATVAQIGDAGIGAETEAEW
ncbi:MAG: glycoside hydrolase TIM-barrel-like domain-containing protein [Rickettsiales bacterium]